MSGITGFINFSHSFPDATEQLRAMMSAIQHRGPDESGMYLDNHAALGQTRLSVIAPEAGKLPIHNESQTLWLVSAGTIFNYLELRSEIEAAAHRFHTSTDTEVIHHLYVEQGMELLPRLNGQFAFELWATRPNK